MIYADTSACTGADGLHREIKQTALEIRFTFQLLIVGPVGKLSLNVCVGAFENPNALADVFLAVPPTLGCVPSLVNLWTSKTE